MPENIKPPMSKTIIAALLPLAIILSSCVSPASAPQAPSVAGSMLRKSLTTWDKFYIEALNGRATQGLSDINRSYALSVGPNTLRINHYGHRTNPGRFIASRPVEVEIIAGESTRALVTGECKDDTIRYIIRDLSTGAEFLRTDPISSTETSIDLYWTKHGILSGTFRILPNGSMEVSLIGPISASDEVLIQYWGKTAAKAAKGIYSGSPTVGLMTYIQGYTLINPTSRGSTRTAKEAKGIITLTQD